MYFNKAFPYVPKNLEKSVRLEVVQIGYKIITISVPISDKQRQSS